ncbi:MAG: hypothetical protein HY909_22775 [Deltaproteobacteria bacterium]|nr:hypothetical protein [Deltaproteobacteria bacterium]
MTKDRGRPLGAVEEVLAVARSRRDPRVELTLPEEGAAPVALCRVAVVRKVCSVHDGDVLGPPAAPRPQAKPVRLEAPAGVREVLALRVGRRDGR